MTKGCLEPTQAAREQDENDTSAVVKATYAAACSFLQGVLPTGSGKNEKWDWASKCGFNSVTHI